MKRAGLRNHGSRRRSIRNSHVYNGPHPGCGFHGVIQEMYGAKIYITVTVCQVFAEALLIYHNTSLLSAKKIIRQLRTLSKTLYCVPQTDILPVKYIGAFYEGEILKISSKWYLFCWCYYLSVYY